MSAGFQVSTSGNKMQQRVAAQRARRLHLSSLAKTIASKMTSPKSTLKDVLLRQVLVIPSQVCFSQVLAVPSQVASQMQNRTSRMDNAIPTRWQAMTFLTETKTQKMLSALAVVPILKEFKKQSAVDVALDYMLRLWWQHQFCSVDSICRNWFSFAFRRLVLMTIARQHFFHFHAHIDWCCAT